MTDDGMDKAEYIEKMRGLRDYMVDLKTLYGNSPFWDLLKGDVFIENMNLEIAEPKLAGATDEKFVEFEKLLDELDKFFAGFNATNISG